MQVENLCDSAAFLLPKIFDMAELFERGVLEACVAHAKDNAEVEACGLVLNCEPKKFYALENELNSPNSFELTSRVNLIRKRVFCIFHSHPLASASPSDLDVSCSRSIGIPYLIYSVLYDNFIYFDLKKCIPIKV